MFMKIILGSQSKGRKKIMEEMGLEFEVMSADIDEKAIRHDDPKKMVLSIAQAKADALRAQLNESAVLVTADTVVVWQNEVREKPKDAQEAIIFLHGYNIAPAKVVTGVVVTNLATGKSQSVVDVATVYFKHHSDEEIGRLVTDGHVLNYAGAFTLLDKGHVERIDGTIDSVIGLPKDLTKKLIDEVYE
jgi:septum formation protein